MRPIRSIGRRISRSPGVEKAVLSQPGFQGGYRVSPVIQSMTTLERAIAIAAKAHEGQTDKAGAPYILHPLRVMLRMDRTEDCIVAVLHDVIEDSEWTADMLRAEGFSERIIEALESVTKRRGEDYETFIRRAASNPISRRVKLADLADNSDMGRIAALTPKDLERLQKYGRAIGFLNARPKEQ